mmetsp:Transcript_98959/g.255846  ORF Transcript_98959/g.255846 Transcript_98959/m.255846 type:complete len:92 (+) Transcript_98959:1-276(+)
MRALFGWQDQPTPVEFFAYAFYWVAVTIVGYIFVQRAKKQLEELIKTWQAQEEEDAEAKQRKGLHGATPKVIGDTLPPPECNNNTSNNNSL